MFAIPLQEAKAHLPELLAQLRPGEEMTITDQGQPLAQVKTVAQSSWPCQAASAAGKVWMAPDFDAPLEELQDYMQ